MPSDQRTLGRYEIVRELGKGAMGVVYEAVDPAIGRKVALKTILPQPGISSEEQAMRRERFQREARAAGVLSHPNIVTVYDVGEDRYSDTTFFAMEFITGDDLAKVLRARGALPAEEVISVVAQVADALDYAHRNGIVHRDVKPANVVLMPDGRVKVTDFGIAKLDSSTLTQTGAYLGTPTFMAPEMISGRAVDGRADMFSLGVVTYQLLTNQKPFAGENLATLSYQIVNRDPTPVRSHRPDLPPEIEDVFLKVLAKKPEDRYTSCLEFVRDLRSVLLPQDESTVGYEEQTRAAGPGSGKMRAAAGPGSGKMRAAAGPGTGKTRAAARPSAGEITRATAGGGAAVAAMDDGDVEPTRVDAPPSGGAGTGIILGIAAGLAFFFLLVAGVAAYVLLLRPTRQAAGPTAPPPVTASPQAPTPVVTTPPAPPPTPEASPTATMTAPTLPAVPTPDPAEIARKQRNDERWKQALAKYGAEQYDGAIALLLPLLQDDPNYPGAMQLLEDARRAKAEKAEAAKRATPAPMPSMAATPAPTPTPTKVATNGGMEMPQGGGEPAAGHGTHAGGTGEPSSSLGPGGGPVESAGEGATLTINFEHRMEKGGTIVVFVDGKKVIDDAFSGGGKPALKVGKLLNIGKEASYSKEVPVAPGSHEVRVQVSGKGVDTGGTIKGSFKAGKALQLNVGVGSIDKDIELEWD